MSLSISHSSSLMAFLRQRCFARKSFGLKAFEQFGLVLLVAAVDQNQMLIGNRSEALGWLRLRNRLCGGLPGQAQVGRSYRRQPAPSRSGTRPESLRAAAPLQCAAAQELVQMANHEHGTLMLIRQPGHRVEDPADGLIAVGEDGSLQKGDDGVENDQASARAVQGGVEPVTWEKVTGGLGESDRQAVPRLPRNRLRNRDEG